ncbi:MAG: glycosyl transferase family protein [Rhodocyclaceae bacterium]|nr:glycosyl transferase family protein [Rhodocyclaceae bacterium]
MQEHPFAPIIRALGKGKQGSRNLTQEEARRAMGMILAGEVHPMQLGAFLMLLRVKEESAEEVAGFVQAVRDTLVLPQTLPKVRLDWSAYAGKRRQLHWFVLSALLLAENGIPVFMHGTTGYVPDRLFVPEILKALGIPEAASLSDAAAQLATGNFAFVSLGNISPVMHEIMLYRPILGLRSPVHTIARMLNPLGAEAVIEGIFHPGYSDIHQGAGVLLGTRRAAVLKGEGGEPERNPDMACLVKSVVDGVVSETEWPPMFAVRHVKDETMDPARLAAVWRGQASDEYGEAALIGTAAIALLTLGEATTQEEAEAMARGFWQKHLAAVKA